MLERIGLRRAVVMALWALALTPAVVQAAPPAAGDILVASADFGTFPDQTGAVIAVNPDKGAKNVVSSNALSTEKLFENPFAVALEADGNIVVADQGATISDSTADGRVVRVNAATGQQSLLAGGLHDPMGITVAPDGSIYVADESTPAPGFNSGGIIRLSSAGVVTATFTNAGSAQPLFADPLDVDVAPGGNLLVVDDEAGGEPTGGIISVDATTGQQTLFSSNATSGGADAFHDPRMLALPVSGDFVVSNASDGPAGMGTPRSVLGVSRTDGTETVIASGGSFETPYGIGIDYAGRIVVADSMAFSAAGALLQVAADGSQTEITRDLAVPRGLAVVPGAPAQTAAQQTLTVSGAGTGTGHVGSSPAGIDCGRNITGHADCTEAFAGGTQVTLTASPIAGSTFAGFSGAGCSGTATTCQVSMTQAQTVTATFNPPGGGQVPADTTAPKTTLARPRIDHAKRKATFRFSSSEPNSTFRCKLDKRRFAPCRSPRTYRNLRPGKHTLRVKARDAAGNVDRTPAVKRFRIKRRG